MITENIKSPRFIIAAVCKINQQDNNITGVINLEKSLYRSLEKNKGELRSYFDNAADYFFKYIRIFNVQCALVMCEDLVDNLKLWEVFLKPLNNLKGRLNPDEVFDYMKNHTTIPFNPTTADNFDQAMFFLTAGFALILIDGVNQAMVMPVQGYPARGVEKPTNEGNLRGSKESFTDTGRKNMGMIRRRIRGENLVVSTMQTGEKTKTEITMYYHTDYCPQQLAETVKKRLENIELPMIFESGYVSPFVDVTSGSLFQSVGYTERPDTFCAKLCEGKVGIMVDGTPYAMVYPYFFHENFVTNDDYTQRPYFASFIRILRYLAFVIAVMLPGFYVGITSYAPQALTDKLIFFVYSSRRATPLPLFMEAVVIISLLEIIKEAGLRLPTPVGSAVSIVSALIIGDAAINAGLIGSAILIVCAVSTRASFIIPAFYEPVISLRIIFVIAAGIFGISGIAFATLFLFINIVNVNSAGYDYSYIFNMSTGKGMKDGITKTSWRKDKNDFDLKGLADEN